MEKRLFVVVDDKQKPASKIRKIEDDSEETKASKIKIEEWLRAEANKKNPNIRYSHAFMVKELFLMILSFLKPLDVYNLRVALGHERAMKIYYKRELEWPKCFMEKSSVHSCSESEPCFECASVGSGPRPEICAFIDHNRICSYCGNVCCKESQRDVIVWDEKRMGNKCCVCLSCWVAENREQVAKIREQGIEYGPDDAYCYTEANLKRENYISKYNKH